VQTKAEATIEDLYNAPDDGTYELVNGKLVEMSPTGYRPHRIGFRIARSLADYEERTGSGEAMSDGIAYIVDLPNRRSFSPDASYTFDVPDEDQEMKFISGIPVFAVEVRSEHDYGPAKDREYAEKRADYFAVGTEIVWDVDPIRRTVYSYHRDDPGTPTVFNEDDLANAEPALPGWTIAVVDLFIRHRRRT
jgi:Uma2 family endonuclease